MKTYILKKACPNIGKEIGDYYNGEYRESIAELLEKGVIEEEHECCDGECNHDDCCGKIPENCPLD